MDTTFLKGMKMLQALASSDKPRGVTDLARELDITKSNSHRLLRTLVHCGFAQNNIETGKYSATLKVWELGSQVLARVDVKSVAGIYLQSLADKTSESFIFRCLSRMLLSILTRSTVCIPSEPTARSVKQRPLFAWRPERRCWRFRVKKSSAGFVNRLSSTRRAPLPIRTNLELVREMARVRQLGYAINKGEWRDGVCGIGAPIRDSSKQVIAAVGISGPASRMKPTFMKEQAPVVVEIAMQISRALGYSSQAARLPFRKSA